MKTDEIDRIIAEALEQEKNNHKGKINQKSNKNLQIKKIRKLLNAIFMIGFLLAVIVYFIWPEQKILFFSLGFSSMIIKIAEFIIRFTL